MNYLENISLKKLITLIKTEIKTNSGGSADRVTYDNTASGLAGSNVQEAIDELAGGVLPEDIVFCDEEDAEASTSSINADTVGGYTVDLLKTTFIDSYRPIGSVYISSTNINPSAQFGGTWELIDKEFKEKVITSAGDYVTLNTTNCSTAKGNMLLHNHRIWCNMQFTPSVTVTDSTLEMFTFDLSKLGVSAIGASGYIYTSSMSDAGQSVFTYQITSAGVFSTTDIIIRASETASLATGYTLAMQFELPISYNNMLDEFCDKFYWKRTA